MAQYTSYTVSVTTNSAVVTGATGCLFLTNADPGNAFKIKGDPVIYTIAAVNSDTQLTLSAPYSGTTVTGSQYQITRDYTSSYGFSEVNAGDQDWATHLTQGMIRKVDEVLANFTPSGGTGGAATIAVKDEGIVKHPAATSLNFIGEGVTATTVGAAVSISIPATAVKNEGLSITNSATSIDFTGDGVTATAIGGAVTVNVTGGGAGSGTAVVPIEIKGEGTLLTATPTAINFVGEGIKATVSGDIVTVNVAAGLQIIIAQSEADQSAAPMNSIIIRTDLLV